MSRRIVFVIAALAFPVAACGSGSDWQPIASNGKSDRPPDAHAAASPAEVVALGLTEAQLLDADLVAVDGADLGDVEQINRNRDGKVASLVVEIDDTGPDHHVILPLDGLTVRRAGGDIDLQTSMTTETLSTLPQAHLARK